MECKECVEFSGKIAIHCHAGLGEILILVDLSIDTNLTISCSPNMVRIGLIRDLECVWSDFRNP